MRRQMFAALALVPALALGAAACGGDDDGGKSGANAKPVSDEQKMRDYAKCMRENGVDMPDPENGVIKLDAKKDVAKPQDTAKSEAAVKKCRPLMPNAGKPKPPTPEELEKRRAFSKCMRENGMTKFPDPQPDGTMTGSHGSRLEMDGPKFKAALKACEKYTSGQGMPAMRAN